MLYDISLDITYEYDTPSDGGRHVLRMMPKEMPGIQRVVAATLAIVPQPLEWLNRTDFSATVLSRSFLAIRRPISASR